MHATLPSDERLAPVAAEAWDRADLLRQRGWLRDVRIEGALASCTCLGTVAVATKVDRQRLEAECGCGAPLPCEHVLALLLEVGVEKPIAPDALRFCADPSDPGRARLARADGAPVPDALAETLRWLWWRRDADGALTGEVRTLAQAAMHAPPPAGAPAALFRQRALGESVTVRLLSPASDEGLALAKMLADRGAHPFPGELPAALWIVPDETAFGAWLLLSGVDARADPTLDPKPLSGVEVPIDSGCLPARIKDHTAIRAFVEKTLGAPPTLDAEHGHILVPATRIVDVEDGLRALGADITYKRLAPPHARFLDWRPELPEDLRGARPRLREPFHGEVDRPIPRLKDGVELASYQKEAVGFILHHGHTCLLADDMGLGKTLESIAAAQFLDGRVLVVCPASAREVWHREVGKFTTDKASVLLPGAAAPTDDGAKYVVVGYSNLEAHRDELGAIAFDLVILDESHYVKNAASGRAKLVTDMLGKIPRRLVVSGTPVMNTPDEIRAQLAFLHPDEWRDGAWFKSRFEEPFEEGSPDVRGQVLERLRQFLDGVMLRREKSTALPDLPPKSILWHRLALPPEARRAYVALEDEISSDLEGEGASGKLERLKQAALAGKMPEAIAFVRRLVSAGNKVVVFSKYRDPLASLERDLADLGPVSITGDTPPEARGEAETRFQTDATCRVFLGQLVAAGTALTLVAGTHAVFLDLDWNPANHRQAMDRIHRRGQTRPVTAHFFLAQQTVDEDIALVLDEKGRMMDVLLSPSAPSAPHAAGGLARQVARSLLARRAAASAPAPSA